MAVITKHSVGIPIFIVAILYPLLKNKNWKSSLNGTYVNSQKINSQGAIIKPGDIITLGDTKFRVEGL